MGAYSRLGTYKLFGLSGWAVIRGAWALIRRWVLNRINMVIHFVLSMYILCSLLASYLLVSNSQKIKL